MPALFYPAIFHPEEEGGYWVTFPDVPEAVTGGQSTQETYQMAIDCLGLCLTTREDEGEILPTPSEISSIELNQGDHVVMVQIDLLKYRELNNFKSVKKTLTIPAWLNDLALANRINFSQVLQEALKTKLNL